MKSLLLWFLLAQGADIGTTLAASSSGCQEVVWPSVTVGTAAKSAALAVAVLEWPVWSPKLRLLVGGVGVVSGSFGAAWNTRQLAKGCR